MRPPSTDPGGVGTTPKRRSSMPRAVRRTSATLMALFPMSMPTAAAPICKKSRSGLIGSPSCQQIRGADHREWVYSRLVRRVPATRWGNLAPSVAAGPGDQEDGTRRGGVEEDGGKHIGHGGIVLYRHGSGIRYTLLDGDAAVRHHETFDDHGHEISTVLDTDPWNRRALQIVAPVRVVGPRQRVHHPANGDLPLSGSHTGRCNQQLPGCEESRIAAQTDVAVVATDAGTSRTQGEVFQRDVSHHGRPAASTKRDDRPRDLVRGAAGIDHGAGVIRGWTGANAEGLNETGISGAVDNPIRLRWRHTDAIAC